MVRFSFFQTNNSSNKSKKMVRSSSSDAIAKNFQDDSQNLALKQSSTPTSSNLLLSKAQSQQIKNNQNPVSNLAVVGHAWSSVDLKGKFDNEFDGEVHPTRNLKKCQSLGSGLDQEEMFYTDNLTYGDRGQSSSYDASNSHQYTIPGCKKDQEANPSDFYKKNLNSEFQLSSDLGNYGSIFSIEDPIHSDKDANENSDTPAGDSADRTPDAPSLVARSRSLPNIGALTLSPVKCSCRQVVLQSTSSEDLYVLNMNQNDKSIDESDNQVIVGQPKENFNGKTEKKFIDSSFDDACDSCTLSGLAKDWAMPNTDGRNDVKALQGEPSVRLWDEMHNSDFKIKRIEEWVTDLQHCGPLEETTESSMLVDPLTTDANTMDSLSAAKADGKVTPSMEAAKRYISCLNANVSAAQLANHGLVVIPFLSAFASLKVLNLSGNAIVKITSGALPRGLHILNLSKNSISTIEGLRELTRLRVLDLSYNRISRIGHGLASCSSLKELYLARNKISEVEGLHRLLKLSVLDLRFNKISTAKSLGQLASNYNSLQAISLEGNPAQKNVGDEQVKKYLQSLLPHLAYYNGQYIKASSLKDGADRSIRLGMSSHQFDRSLRSDHKNARKSSLGSASRKPASSTAVARRSQAVVSPKRSKGRQGHLPPIGTRAPSPSPYHFDFSNKPSNFKTDLSMRKSRSEGTIGVL